MCWIKQNQMKTHFSHTWDFPYKHCTLQESLWVGFPQADLYSPAGKGGGTISVLAALIRMPWGCWHFSDCCIQKWALSHLPAVRWLQTIVMSQTRPHWTFLETWKGFVQLFLPLFLCFCLHPFLPLPALDAALESLALLCIADNSLTSFERSCPSQSVPPREKWCNAFEESSCSQRRKHKQSRRMCQRAAIPLIQPRVPHYCGGGDKVRLLESYMTWETQFSSVCQ